MSIVDRFFSFVHTLADAEIIDELNDLRLPGAARRADVLFADRSIVAEVKSLETDTSPKIDTILQPYRDTDFWPMFYGEWPVAQILKHLPEAKQITERIGSAITSAIRDQVRSANRQIRETKRALSIPSASGLLILLNADIDVLAPKIVASEVARQISKKAAGGTGARFADLHAIWVINEAHLLQVGDAPMKLSMMAYNPHIVSPQEIEPFINGLQERWAASQGAPTFLGHDGVLDLPLISMRVLENLRQPKRRYEKWQLAYRSNPYLARLSDEELFAWARELQADIAPRMLKGAKPTPIAEMRPKWERWTHFLEEIARRGIDLRVWGPEVKKGFADVKPWSPDMARGNPPEQRVVPGSFYRNSRMGTSYFCEGVSEGLCRMILLESNPPLMQCRFSQSLAWSWQYEEVTEAAELDRLQALLQRFETEPG